MNSLNRPTKNDLKKARSSVPSRPVCRFPSHERSRKSRFGQSGQIVIEYILLLAIAVSIAILITRTLIGREEGSEGFVINAWQALITQIGADPADDVKKPPEK